MIVLEARDLQKSYGSGPSQVHALRGVSFTDSQGEIIAIVGKSGSGKSTLLGLLGGVDTPTSGQVLIEDVDLASLDDDARTILRRRRIGFVFQAFNLLPNLSALENVALPLELDGVSTAAAAKRAAEALEMVEMSHRKDQFPTKLSGGEQQRVAVARALVIKPALVLADEPTGNLDTTNSQKVTSLLRRLVDDHGQTVLMVTHDLEVAGQADRIIQLRDGLIEDDSAAVQVTVQRLHAETVRK